MAEKLQTTQVFEEEWDKKKIAIAIGVLIFLIAGFIGVRSYLLPMLGFKNPAPERFTQRVKGAETSVAEEGQPIDTPEKISLPTANDIQQKISDVQNEVSHLSLQDIASSSPQVQAILQQIQTLPKTPANIAKQACINLCNRL